MGQILSCSCEFQRQLSQQLGLPHQKFVLQEDVSEYGQQINRVFIARELQGQFQRGDLCMVRTYERGQDLDAKLLLKQIRAHCILQNLGVPRLNEVLLTQTHLIVSLEHFQGITLQEYVYRNQLSTGGLSEEEARFVFRQIVDIVYYCYERGVPPMELNPLSIGITTQRPHNFVTLLSIGLSHNSSSAQSQKTQMLLQDRSEGMQIFDSQRQSKFQHRDVWHLGVILYVLLTGTYPYQQQENHTAADNNTTASRFHRSPLKSLDTNTQNSPRSKGRRDSIRQNTPDSLLDCKAQLPERCLDVLEAMLCMDSSKRIKLEDLRKHAWVTGPMTLEHARAFQTFQERNELAKQDLKFGPGSVGDNEIRQMVALASLTEATVQANRKQEGRDQCEKVCNQWQRDLQPSLDLSYKEYRKWREAVQTRSSPLDYTSSSQLDIVKLSDWDCYKQNTTQNH